MGRNSPVQVVRLVLHAEENRGERLPILFDRDSRTPIVPAMEWAIAMRRNRPVTANTLERELRHLGHFEVWLRREYLNLQDPIAFVDRFTPNRIEASLRPWLGKDLSDRKIRRLSVSPSVIRDRILVIASFVDWVLQNAERSFSIRTQHQQMVAFGAARASVGRSLHDILPRQTSTNKEEGLSGADVARLLAVIDPMNPRNPWARGSSENAIGIRYRNQLIVLLMLAFGPRRGDVLKLQTADVKTHGAEPTLWIRRRPDDRHDPRVFEPNAKTQERMLPLDKFLARRLDDYVSEHRKMIPNSKKTPYLFLSTNTGMPLSSRAVNDIFESLQDQFPGVHPHICRHTHNDRLRALCRDRGIDQKEATSHAMYLNGWLGDNTGIYTKRESRMTAHAVSKQVQDKLFST
ncbi:MAG: tyrosine-type recombinase/integrase [Hylemonella sp.]